MSKLNKNTVSHPMKIATRVVGLSENGNLQFVKNSYQELFELVIGSMYGSDTIYKTGQEKINRLRLVLASVINAHGTKGMDIAAKMALFARHKLGLRTMPIVMIVELLNEARKQSISFEHTRKMTQLVINRADELTDFYSYSLSIFGEKGKIPLAVKKGVADAFNKFDAYQFAKYNRKDGLTMKQLLRIVHPSPTSAVQSDIFDKLMKDSLPSPNTWEVRLSANGQLPESERLSKKDLWTELVRTKGAGELGFIALVRNLRNIVEAGVDSSLIDEIAIRLQDPKQIERARMLPWGFITAYEIAESSNFPRVLMNALSNAIDISLSNMPELGEKVWIIGDVSGSMTNTIIETRKSIPGVSPNRPSKYMSILAAALLKASKKDVMFTTFSTTASHVKGLNTNDTLMTLFNKIQSKCSGGGTNLQSAFNLKSSLPFDPDTVIVLSDMEIGGSGYNSLSYTKVPNFSKDAVKIAINFNSSETTPLDPRDGWIQLAGWSEKIFRFVELKRNSVGIVDQFINDTIEVI